ncbi:MAG: hypothetical protein NW206_08125 [Hyphomonadaceae bacterium]|nr:hypothetical protein [Hyphomonadaceae bacterium]
MTAKRARVKLVASPLDDRDKAWYLATDGERSRLTAKFKNSFQKHLPTLADDEVAARELEAVFFHDRIYTVRSGLAKAEVKKIRGALERVASLDGAFPALHALFKRRHEDEYLAPVIECIFMLQVWQNSGVLDTVLDKLELAAESEIAATRDTGSIKWPGVWAIDALIALWCRQKGGSAWTSVKWEGPRGDYLSDGFEFLNKIVDLHGADPRSAFNRWKAERSRPNIV